MNLPFDPARFMSRMGRSYETLYRLPGLGDPLVRGLNRGIGRMNFHLPFLGLRRHDSIDGFRKDFLKLTGMMQLPVEIIAGSETPDGFEFYVQSCPYGYQRADQQGVCDAAMDMDRVLFGMMGADLTILESTVQGAPRCRISLRLSSGAKA
jgi:hypothetical protein